MINDVIKHLQQCESEVDKKKALYLERICSIARAAGAIVLEAYYKDKDILTKACQADLVTETDQLVEKFIFDSIKESFPEDCLIGEETVAAEGTCTLTDAPTWIVDPIDGTTNFVHRFPYTCVSIGFVIAKRVEIGVVFAPVLNDFYVGVRGHGAYVNDKPMKVSSTVNLSEALLASEWGASRDASQMDQVTRNFQSVIQGPSVHGMRSTGSAALNMALIARGSVDLYFEFGPHCWDVAAGSVMLEEAGGIVLTTKGGPFDIMGCKHLAACNRGLADKMVPYIKDITTKRDDE